ncbi:hypothetical protein A3J22_00985 [Candidatus Beckwithbacteria bacterium RIFCSPLOWO2_02_FULL_49_12]|nr:MAG: polysaccharide ABC exporter membrane-spanning protein [Candidatus Beckwithbacteria bacterium GW2011_GWC1_49_16]OGD48965.1 MAG: hypothetical protein A2877_01370 [Candidatus Beckwithbacteria bacterium RIFCSPHIGHO2_01_FULL_49_39]OGD51747.1 MAG: hypothetical protein A3K56_05180 [Candidatus Beckwithbacteria bacterium RIFCSPHIGHO2_12_FULL_49_13]OGD58313.1 MAG: hypothetical protein A3J22_00985 [Candidatus Beckwithbacteria bacterium RIFCSPLOWO2_02_FULL_49_12]OGD65492.1 MAG: hypothetical protein
MSKPKFSGNIWDLFYELVRTDFVLRYHNSLLGFIWVLLKPFLIFAIMVTVFSLAFKIQDRLYSLNLLLGLLIYSYFAEATLRGITSLTEKSTIILKVNFPKAIAILTSVVNSFISFFFGFLAFLGFWFWVKPDGSLLNLPYFFLLVLILTILIIGLNFFLSIGYTKLKDLLSIWEVLLQLLLYLSPIIYPLSYVPAKYQSLFLLNPMAVIITQSQAILITGQVIDWWLLGYTLMLAIVVLIVGRIFFQGQIKRVNDNF